MYHKGVWRLQHVSPTHPWQGPDQHIYTYIHIYKNIKIKKIKYYSFRHIHVDLMHQSYFHHPHPQGETWGFYGQYMEKYG